VYQYRAVVGVYQYRAVVGVYQYRAVVAEYSLEHLSLLALAYLLESLSLSASE
jgi:hypothetical protein